MSPETALLPGGKLAYGEERGKALSDGGYPPPSRLLPGPGAWVPQPAASVEGSGAINLGNNIHGSLYKHVVRIAAIIFHHFATPQSAEAGAPFSRFGARCVSRQLAWTVSNSLYWLGQVKSGLR